MIFESTILKIAMGLFGIFMGIFWPFTVGYLVMFYKKRDFGFKLILQLIIRFLLILILYGIFMGFATLLLDKITLGWIDSRAFQTWGVIGTNLGFWGGVILLIIGFKHGKKRRTSKKINSHQTSN